jgi:hypothetical protein
MDNEIFNRYKESMSPFDGSTLFTNSTIPLNKLRKLVRETISFLKRNQLLNCQMYKVWDWFEHDGYLPPKEFISDDFITEFTKDISEFYKYRAGDTYVKLGLYDLYSRWYIRIYIIDEYDLEDGEEVGGTMDISSNEEIIKLLKKYLSNYGYSELYVRDSKSYFEKRYAGY